MLPDRVSNPEPLTYDSGAKLLLWPVTVRIMYLLDQGRNFKVR